MTVRLIDQDEHYGHIGFGSMTSSSANAFSSAQLDTIAEPDFIISRSEGQSLLSVEIEDVLVWDNREWVAKLQFTADVAGTEDLTIEANGGITKDNTSGSSNGPTAKTVAEGVFPGGSGTSVAGTAGVTNSARTVGQETPEYEAYFEYGFFTNEQQDATGHINNNSLRRVPYNVQKYSPYRVNGITCHNLMTAAHYWQWSDSTTITSTLVQGIGANVRRMSIDLEELLFDRETIFSLLDALELIS